MVRKIQIENILLDNNISVNNSFILYREDDYNCSIWKTSNIHGQSLILINTFYWVFLVNFIQIFKRKFINLTFYCKYYCLLKRKPLNDVYKITRSGRET